MILMRTRILGFISTALFLMTSGLWASEAVSAPKEVTVDSISAAYKLAKSEVAAFRAQGEQLGAVELYHVGASVPEELKALAAMLRAEGVQDVKTVTMTPAELDYALSSDRFKSAENDTWKAAKLLRYELGAKDRETAARKRFVARARQLRDGMRHLFGIPKGVTFAMYLNKRALGEHLVEGGVAAAKVLFTAQVIYHSVLARSLAIDAQLNAPLSMAVGAAFGFFFDYFQRGNGDFKGQGMNFNFAKARFDMNLKFYFFTAFMHSFIMRELMMAAAHMTDAGFTMGWNDFFRALGTTSMGLMGRVPVEMWIQKARARHGKWWSIGVMTAWGIAYSALQAVDMFSVQSVMGLHVGEFFRYTLMALGTTGLGITLYRERDALFDWIKNVRLRVTGQAAEIRAACETLLIFRSRVK